MVLDPRTNLGRVIEKLVVCSGGALCTGVCVCVRECVGGENGCIWVWWVYGYMYGVCVWVWESGDDSHAGQTVD